MNRSRDLASFQQSVDYSSCKCCQEKLFLCFIELVKKPYRIKYEIQRFFI